MQGAVIAACMSLALAMSAALPADAAPGDLPVLYVNATGPLTPLDHDLLAVPKIPVGSALHNAPARVALGDTIVLWLVTHDDGGQELYRQVITTRDVDPPEFVDGQDTYVTGRTGKLTDANFEVPTAVDAVDLDVDVSRSHEPGSGFRTGNTTVKFTATDDSGNSAVHEMVVVVTDPRIRNLVLEATHDRIRATWDPLPGNPQYKASISERGGDALETAKTRDTVHVFHNLDESTEYVVTVGEVGERSTTVRKTVATGEAVGRNKAVFPDDVVREATAPLTPVHLGGVIIYDWDPAPSISNDAPAAFPVGNTTVTWTVTDGVTTITGEQVVAITDTTKPVFSNLPVSSTHRATSERGAEVRFVIPAATDAADPDVAVKPSHISGSHFPVGKTTVVFTATDGSGNTARHEIVITVRLFEIAAPDDIVKEATAPMTPVGLGRASVPGAWIPAPTISNDAPEAFPVGNTTVTWTAADGVRTVTDTQVVSIRDTKPPVFTGGFYSHGEWTSSLDGSIARFGMPRASDIADPNVVVTSSPPPGSLFPLGYSYVTSTARDASGNEAKVAHGVVVTWEPDQIGWLGLEPTNDTIKVQWYPHGGEYEAVIKEADTGDVVDSIRTNNRFHTFSELEPDTVYAVRVHKTDNESFSVSRMISTLPRFFIYDDFSDYSGWRNVPHVTTVFGNPDGVWNYTFVVDKTEGNPAPSGKLSGNSYWAFPSIRGDSLHIGNIVDNDMYLSFDYKTGGDVTEPTRFRIIVGSSGKTVASGTLAWHDNPVPDWKTVQVDLSDHVPSTLVKIIFTIYEYGDKDNNDEYAFYIDNFTLSSSPKRPEFQGGSGGLGPMTLEQAEFERILRHMEEGKIDPREYFGSAAEPRPFDDMLRDIIWPGNVTGWDE